VTGKGPLTNFLSPLYPINYKYFYYMLDVKLGVMLHNFTFFNLFSFYILWICEVKSIPVWLFFFLFYIFNKLNFDSIWVEYIYKLNRRIGLEWP